MHALLAAAVLAVTAVQADTTYLYRTHFIRAAPGEILELVEVLQERMSFYDAAGEPAPFIMRHAQGDHWDLQIMYPMGSFMDYYSPARVERRASAATASGVTEEQFRRTFQHPEMGSVTLDLNLQLYAWHGRHHIAQVLSLRDREGW